MPRGGSPSASTRGDVAEPPTGCAVHDEAYLRRCVSCEQLRTLIMFLALPDIEFGLDIYGERCIPPPEGVEPSDDP